MCGSGAIGTEHLRPCDCITLLQVIQYLVVPEKVGVLMHSDELLWPWRRRRMYARIAYYEFYQPRPVIVCHPEHIRFAQCKLREGSLDGQRDASLRRSFAALRMTVPVLVGKLHYRLMARRCPPQADKSAVRQYIVRLRGMTDLWRMV
jgi:hypothetical protein